MGNAKRMHFENLFLSLQELWGFDKRIIFISLASVCINSILPFPNIFFSGRIVDSISTGKDFRLVILNVIFLFGTSYLLTSVDIVLGRIKEFMFIKLMNKLDNDINRKCLSLDFEQYNDSSMQHRIMMVNQAVRGNNFFTSLNTFFAIISRFITLVGIICVMSALNIWLLFIAIVVIALQALFHYIQLKQDRKYQEDSSIDRRKNAYISQLSKDIHSKKDIIMFGMSEYIMKKTEEFQQSMLMFDKRRIKVRGIVGMATYSLSIAFQIFAYLIIGVTAFRGDISIGDFTVGVTSLINFMSASSFVTNNILTFNEKNFYIKQYRSFLKLRNKFDRHPGTISMANERLNKIEIEFRNVSFRYPNSTAFVLKNINLKIKSNERLGIVGYNGAGKTTFTLLLTRMYDPTEGAIYLNGIDIRNIDYQEYQKIFSSVNQDFSLLAFSILENIAIRDDLSDKDKEEVLELINNNGMEERMKKLYRGLDTPITKALSASGVDLSGGERQKIAISRALYKNAPVLILDEPTSALDPVAEHEVFQKFVAMSEGKTSVLISHRIYSTRFCDKIVVLDKGEMKEYGTFDELMQAKGLYYDFFQQQADYFK